MRLCDHIRLTARAIAAAGVTVALWAALDSHGLLARRVDRYELLQRYKIRWSRSLLRVFGVRLLINGAPMLARDHFDRGDLDAMARSANPVGHLFVINHRSALDILVVCATTESVLVSRHDLADWPFVGHAARRASTLFVDRSSPKSGAEIRKGMADELLAGHGVALFPEGTAYRGDEVHKFRTGAFAVAARTGARIIPMGVAYENDDATYGDESFGAHAMRLSMIKRQTVTLEFGLPIEPEGQSVDELRDHARAQVIQLVVRARARLSHEAI
ncbi:MAG: hypothetical protein ETSY1_32795 [Candidatus Entotheonella factor]|uniref:Phospholipid/glycerol acyltransferase domain-containing protein n=1 Tax=Entotheonella factor TaxID=1429438 RepID=W4LC69_ENTF1|nr:MAG: hypothetical protein ETSY1_32795 [Candidatus Entotheonella factor]